MTELQDIKSLSIQELTTKITDMGFPGYRADQIFSWLHKSLVKDFDEMTNLPLKLRELLKTRFELLNVKIKEVYISKIDGTRKYLFELNDGSLIESVLMMYHHGNSVCVSSQVGCDMGCRFCASTIDGCLRNLKPSEILSQVYEIQKDTGVRVSNIVVMGMGEPLINYDNVMKFVRLISDENALHISQRNITISTCGILPNIVRMADESLSVTLAISLHAPNDSIRQGIMPVAKKYPIKGIIDASKYYFNKTGRRVTFEYCLIGGVNDSKENALELAELLKGMNAHVNLIPLNPTPGNDFDVLSDKSFSMFYNTLKDKKIQVTKRREMGRDINGACGQLVRRQN